MQKATSLESQLRTGDGQLVVPGAYHTGGAPGEAVLLLEIMGAEPAGMLWVVLVGRREIIYVKCPLAFLLTFNARLRVLQSDSSD